MKYNTNKLIILCLFIVFLLSTTTMVSATDNNNNTHEITKDSTNTIDQTVETTTTEYNGINKIQKNYKNLKTEDNTYTVTVSSGQELKDEIENAKNSRYKNYTINYQKGEYDSDYVMDAYNLEWGNSRGVKILTLNGNGINFVGMDTNHFLTVNSGYTFIINNCTLSHFNGSNGGAIKSEGTLKIYNSSFDYNKASNNGGAVYGTNLTIINSKFKNNNAGINGGAVYGTNITISNCEFEENQAINAGAIYSNFLNINESIFTFNHADNYGGAIRSDYLDIYFSSFTNNYLNNISITNITRFGGVIYSTNTINIEGSIFENNSIVDYSDHWGGTSYAITQYRYYIQTDKYGGAICGLQNINIINSTFNNNSLNGYYLTWYSHYWQGSSGKLCQNITYLHSNGYGGSIYSKETIKIINSSFENNYAYNSGGALYGKNIITDNSSFKSNKINGTQGNTIYSEESITITNSKIDNENEVTTAIYGKNNWSSITVKNCEFNNNNASVILVPYITIYNSHFKNNDIKSRTAESVYNSTFNTNITCDIDVMNPHLGEMITLTFSLRDQNNDFIDNKNFTVKIGSEMYYLTTDYDGYATINYTIPTSDDIPITIIYNGSKDTYNRNSTFETILKVEKEKTRIILNNIKDTVIRNNITIVGQIIDENNNIPLNNQIITVLINDESQQTTTDENGYYNITYTTSTLGINNITVLFEGNEIYPSATAYTTFNVDKIPTTIKLNTLDYTFNNDETVILDIKGELTDYQNEKINNQEIILNINNQTYNIITDNNVFIKQIQLDRGYYPITLIYKGNDYYNNTSLETFINITDKKQSKLTVFTKQITDINEELPIIIILEDEEDNPIIQEEVEIEITNEEKITKTTNNIGLINLTYTPTTIGEKNIYVTFNGNNQYNKTNKTETITILNRNDSINEQQDLIQSLNNTVNNLTRENTNLNNTVSNLTNENTNLNNQVSNLTNENQLLNNTINELENTTTQQQDIINTLNNTNTELQEENNRQNQTIKELNELITSLENYELVNELKDEIETLNETNNNLTNTIQNLNNNITNLTNENNQKQNTIDTLTETNNNLNNTITNLTEKNQELNETNKQLTQQNNELNNNNTALNEENNNIKLKNQELNETNKQLTQQNTELTQQNNELNNNITALNEENTQLNSQINNLTKNNTQLNQQINTLNNTIKQQNNTIQNLNNTNNQLNNLLDEQRSVNNQLNDLIREYDDTITNLEQENLENTALINQLNKDKTRLENELLNKDKNITDLTKTINELYNEKNQLRNQINNLTRESINKDNQIAQMDDLIKQLNNTNNNLNKQITQLTNDIKDKNNTITQLNNTNKNLNNEIKNQQQTITNLNNTNKNQNNTINNLQNENKNLNNTNKQLQNNITQLNNTITKLEKELTKNATTISVDKINGRVGSQITLKATVKDQQGKAVNEGKVVFKVNGITLKDSESNPLYAQVTNGIATLNYVIPKSWMKNNTKVEVAFSETIHYKSSRNTTTNNIITPGDVKLKIADMPVHENGDKTQFVITATDERGNTINGGTILLKANGVTLKDSNGKALQATIQNGVAIIDYNITLGARTHDITAVYAYTGYNRIEAKNKLTVTKGDIFIRCNPITTNKNSTQIIATIVDKNKNKIAYDMNIGIKINGTSITSSMSQDGLINITVPTKFNKGTYLLEFIAGETGAYKSDRLTTVIIKK